MYSGSKNLKMMGPGSRYIAVIKSLIKSLVFTKL